MGFGTVMSTAQIIVQTIAGRHRLGSAVAVVSLARSVGGAAGAAAFGALVFSLLGTHELDAAVDAATQATGAAPLQQVAHAFRIAFSALAAFTALSAISATRIRRVKL